jgi:hypothetical protein
MSSASRTDRLPNIRSTRMANSARRCRVPATRQVDVLRFDESRITEIKASGALGDAPTRAAAE